MKRSAAIFLRGSASIGGIAALISCINALKKPGLSAMRSSESTNMPGVIGSGGWPFFSAQVCGVSRKLNHSNSMPVMTWKPSFSARLSTRFKVWRGHSGCGEPSAFTNSPRKNGTLPGASSTSEDGV